MFKPMKPPSGALTDEELGKVRFPLLGSHKYDGIRASVQGGVLLSSTLKPIPNIRLQKLYGRPELNGLDGELVIGDPCDPLGFHKTTSQVMSVNAVAAGICFYVFDCYHASAPYEERVTEARVKVSRACSVDPDELKVAPMFRLNSHQAVAMFEESAAMQGWEGTMYRDPYGVYKEGRSTIQSQGLLRRKPFDDAEALILDTEEQLENLNEKFTDEMGHSKRSSHAENKVPKGLMGKYVVRGLTAFPGVEFKIGCFGDLAEQKKQWDERGTLPGKIVKFKYQKHGSKDAPRLPIALGFRDPEDMTV